ncbi:MAG: zinc-dependent alcohol dehydrogenase family protein [Candidatus Eiseniibacteriota bacterium]|jgi:propanol-preferring alcohol dehydrogenase
MRAMQLDCPRPIERRPLAAVDRETPEPGPGEVRIRVHVCGVCHTDLHTVEGDLELPRLPLVPGHQVVGLIDAVGPGVEDPAVGDRIGVAWMFRTCGSCRYCTTGRENLCESAEFTGLHADGGYAESMIVPAGFVYPVPEGFGDREAAPLLCGGVIGYRALVLSEVRPGARLGLYGFGSSAHVTIQVARHQGCEVYVWSRSEAHRRHAEALGAVWTGAVPDRPPVAMDGSILFAPAGELVPPALEALDRGGTLALAGIHMSPLPSIDYRRIYGERAIRSVANATRDDARDLLEMAAAIPIRTDVSEHPLADANQVLAALKRSDLNGSAVLRVS